MKQGSRWVAAIRNEGKQQHLGSFNDEHKAALAYDVEARKLGRETNFADDVSDEGEEEPLSEEEEEEGDEEYLPGAIHWLILTFCA